MAAQTNPDAQVPVALALAKLAVFFTWEWVREVSHNVYLPVPHPSPFRFVLVLYKASIKYVVCLSVCLSKRLSISSSPSEIKYAHCLNLRTSMNTIYTKTSSANAAPKLHSLSNPEKGVLMEGTYFEPFPKPHLRGGTLRYCLADCEQTKPSSSPS